MKTRLFCILFISFVCVKANGQTTNSPYSILGIGDIETDHYNRTSGMANSGQAYRNDRFLINNNPASYSALQPQFFAFEVSGRAQFATYRGSPLNGSSASNKDFAIKRVTVGTKIAKWWGSSAGLTPYSTSNYSFNSQKNIQGTNISAPATYDGSGGVNQVYWSNSFQPIKHFSVGVNAAYLFGSLTQTENLVTNGLGTTLATTRQTFYKNFHLTYGAQYYTSLSKNWDISLGGTYSPEQKLAADATVTVMDNDVQISSVKDTRKNLDFKLAQTTAFGFAITKGKKYTLTGDYKIQSWSAVKFVGPNYALKDSRRASLGFEISNHVKNISTLFEKSFVQAGVYYGTSYLQIDGHQLNEAGFTLGYGLFRIKTITGSTLGFTLGLDAGQRGTQKYGLIKENYINFTLTVSYRDLWRTRGIRYL